MNTIPHFTGRNVPLQEISQALDIPEEVIAFGIECEELFFGTAIKFGGKSYFICPDKKVWEETGYFKEGQAKWCS